MNIRELNEEFRKFYEANSTYELQILVNADRGYEGDLKTLKFKAKNDLDAILKVFKKYNLQTSYIFEDDDLYPEQEQQRDEILNCLKEDKIERGVKLITDLYFDDFDPSDLYDKIVYIKNGDRVIFEDEYMDVSDLDDPEDEEDEEDAVLLKVPMDKEYVKQETASFKKWVNEHQAQTGLLWVPKYAIYRDGKISVSFNFKGGSHVVFDIYDKNRPKWTVGYDTRVLNHSFNTREELQNWLLENPYRDWLKQNKDKVLAMYNGDEEQQQLKQEMEDVLNS